MFFFFLSFSSFFLNGLSKHHRKKQTNDVAFKAKTVTPEGSDLLDSKYIYLFHTHTPTHTYSQSNIIIIITTTTTTLENPRYYRSPRAAANHKRYLHPGNSPKRKPANQARNRNC